MTSESSLHQMHINNLIGEVLPPSLTSIPLGYRRESYLQTAIAVRVYKYGSLQSLAHQWLIENLPKNDGVARQKEGVVAAAVCRAQQRCNNCRVPTAAAPRCIHREFLLRVRLAARRGAPLRSRR